MEALKAFAGGIRFIITTPSVWLYSMVPAGMFLLGMMVFGGLGISGPVAEIPFQLTGVSSMFRVLGLPLGLGLFLVLVLSLSQKWCATLYVV